MSRGLGEASCVGKLQKWGLLAPFSMGELCPHLTQCGLNRGLPLHQVAPWSILPFGHNTPALQRHPVCVCKPRTVFWSCCAPFCGGGSWVPI